MMQENKNLKILSADLNDTNHAQAIIDLLNHYAQDPAGGGNGLSEFVKRNLINALQKQSHCLVVLAFVDNEPVGMAICFLGFSTFACAPLLNIHDFVVHKKFRGHGLAYKILDEVEQYAKGKSCCKVTLEVLQNNQSARHVYERFGFRGYELTPEMGQAIFLEKELIQ